MTLHRGGSNPAGAGMPLAPAAASAGTDAAAGAFPRRLELDAAGRAAAAAAMRPGAPPDEVNPGRRVGGGRVYTVLRERHRPKRGPPRE